VNVNGKSAHPLFQYLKKQAPGLMGTKSIKWNFTKFLVNRRGWAVQRFAPKNKPEVLVSIIETLLNEK
jgi:glutathione peroxidase